MIEKGKEVNADVVNEVLWGDGPLYVSQGNRLYGAGRGAIGNSDNDKRDDQAGVVPVLPAPGEHGKSDVVALHGK